MIELRLSIARGARWSVARRAAITFDERFAFAAWNAEHVDLLDPADAAYDCRGPFYVSVDLAEVPELAPALDSVLERRPDAVAILRQAERTVESESLSIPIRVAVLDGDDVSLAGTPEDIAEWAFVHPLDVDAMVELLQDSEAQPPHVLHLPIGAHVPAIIEALASSRTLPMLVVLEAVDDHVDREELFGTLQELGEAGCSTVVVLTATRRDTLDGAVARFYAKVAQALLDPFGVACELASMGCKVLLLVEESFPARLASAASAAAAFAQERLERRPRATLGRSRPAREPWIDAKRREPLRKEAAR